MAEKPHGVRRRAVLPGQHAAVDDAEQRQCNCDDDGTKSWQCMDAYGRHPPTTVTGTECRLESPDSRHGVQCREQSRTDEKTRSFIFYQTDLDSSTLRVMQRTNILRLVSQISIPSIP